MQSMFQNSAFNQPINLFDTSSVTNMSATFDSNTVFNQDISALDYSQVTSFDFFGIFGFLKGATAFSTANYDLLLIALDAQTVQSGLTFDVASQYSVGAATTARANLIANDSWVINDLGQAP